MMIKKFVAPTLKEAIAKTKKEATYRTAAEFIKWYNQNKLKGIYANTTSETHRT